MVLVALGWQVYEITGSAWDLGLVGLMQFLPALALTLPAGQLVDCIDRRQALMAALAIQVGVALVLAASTLGGWIGRDLILGLSMAIGMARALQMPTQQAIIPSLVPLAQLARATAVSSTVMKGAQVAGPAIGGFMLIFGASLVYGVACAMLAGAIAFVAAMQRIAVPPPTEPVSLRTLLAGIVFVWRHKVVLGAISLDLFAVLLGGATALLPIYAKDVLDVDPWGLGMLRAAPALGALVVGTILARVPLEERVGRKLFVSVAIYGVAILVFGLSTNFWVSLVALAVSGGADMVSVVVRLTLIQVETPDDMRGRVSAVNSTFIGASNELGEFRAGAMGAWLGAVGSVVVGGLGTLLVAALWMKMFPSLARRGALVDRE